MTRPGRLRTEYLRWIGFFALLQVLFLGIAALAMAVPNEPIRHHLAQDFASGRMTDDNYPHDRGGNPIDKFSECLDASLGLGEASYASRFVRNPVNVSCDVVHTATTTPAARKAGRQDYFRYWNGFMIFSRPLLALGGILPLRIATIVLLAGAALALLYYAGTRLSWWAAVAVVGPLIATTNLVWSPMSFPQGISAAAALGGGALVVAWCRASRNWFIPPLVAASVYCFLDQMYNIPLAWTLTAGLAAAVAVRVGAQPVRAALAAAAGWLVGFVGTWAAKWAFDLAVFGPGRFRTGVLDEIFAWSQTQRAGGGQASRYHALKFNLQSWIGGGHYRKEVAAFALVAIGLAAVVTLRHRWRPVLAVAVTGALTPIWEVAVPSHNAVHAWFTYRGWAASLAVALLGLVLGSLTGGGDLPRGSRSFGSEISSDHDSSVRTTAHPAAGG